jgi:hypothetical protein
MILIIGKKEQNNLYKYKEQETHVTNAGGYFDQKPSELAC